LGLLDLHCREIQCRENRRSAMTSTSGEARLCRALRSTTRRCCSFLVLLYKERSCRSWPCIGLLVMPYDPLRRYAWHCRRYSARDHVACPSSLLYCSALLAVRWGGVP
jgi:hypothetical protein